MNPKPTHGSQRPLPIARKPVEVLLPSWIMPLWFVRLAAAWMPPRSVFAHMALVALLLAALGSYACSSSDSHAPAMAAPHGSGGSKSEGGAGSTGGRSASVGGTGASDVSTGTCTIGDARACRVVWFSVGQESCFNGMQYCDTGAWTGCTDPRDAN